MSIVWKVIYENGNLSVRAWHDFISLIRTVDGEDTEIIISQTELIEIYERLEIDQP
jgi:hypothetical protein